MGGGRLVCSQSQSLTADCMISLSPPLVTYSYGTFGMSSICCMLACFPLTGHWAWWPVSNKKVCVVYGHSMVILGHDCLFDVYCAKLARFSLPGYQHMWKCPWLIWSAIHKYCISIDYIHCIFTVLFAMPTAVKLSWQIDAGGCG